MPQRKNKQIIMIIKPKKERGTWLLLPSPNIKYYAKRDASL